RHRCRHAHRPQAYRLVFERPAGLGRVPRRRQPDRIRRPGARTDPRILRAAAGPGGGLMFGSLLRRSASEEPVSVPDPAALLAALPDPVLALDRDAIVRWVNPAAEQFLGTGAAGLCGHPLAEFILPQGPL